MSINFNFDESDVEYFYKYLPFDDGSVKIITEGTIKFANPLEFNDPFDCLPGYTQRFLDQGIPDYIKSGPRFYRMSPGKRVEAKNKLIVRMRKLVLSGDFLRNLSSQAGVVCLSKSALNILMWSHYADFHRGFVVEFRIPMHSKDPRFLHQAKHGQRLIPQRVIYRENRPCLNFSQRTREGDLQTFEDTFLTKSSHWEYEREHRVLLANKCPGIHPYERDEVLCSVIGGIRMRSNYKELEALVKTTNAQHNLQIMCYLAKEHESKYEISVPGHPRLG